MARTAYFDSNSPKIFAHRGLHQNSPGVKENSLAAFQNALLAGATHLESDVHASKDEVAVLFHDSNLARTHGITKRISDLSFSQLQEISEGSIPALEQALIELPEAKFNLDLKSRAAISPTVQTIEKLQAHERVLVSSFSNKRRLEALGQLSKPVATSASPSHVLKAWLSDKLFGFGLEQVVRDIDAFQIPTKMYFMKFASRRFVDRISKHGKEIHFWTINDPEEMQSLLELGAHGIVSDRVDLFPRNF